jgi:tRNA threonylcarbamoyladenosine biosynthesis protein TsaB
MKILAFDTASDHACVAVQWDEAVHTRKLQGYARHSEHLLAAIAQTFAEKGLGNWQQEIDAIAFGAGPGAFTGVRLACAVAQGMGMALGKPLLALDALALVGRSAYPEGPSGRVWVAADARMGEWYHRWFEVTAGGEWQPRSEPALVSPHTARWDEIAIDPDGTEFRFAGFRLAEACRGARSRRAGAIRRRRCSATGLCPGARRADPGRTASVTGKETRSGNTE